ncbi:MAG: helix-turn-helix domain-containing protein [Pelagimonas sp.]|uniref:helix-turn-helix domain-containing protein n=1 Tax=Pelagimonas sp. TaxID=2073170 RepID=UPI003D6A3340
MRGKNFTEEERDAIRILFEQGYTVRRIAKLINRGKSGVQGQIDRMRADGSIKQTVMNLGQFDEQG